VSPATMISLAGAALTIWMAEATQRAAEAIQEINAGSIHKMSTLVAKALIPDLRVV